MFVYCLSREESRGPARQCDDLLQEELREECVRKGTELAQAVSDALFVLLANEKCDSPIVHLPPPTTHLPCEKHGLRIARRTSVSGMSKLIPGSGPMAMTVLTMTKTLGSLKDLKPKRQMSIASITCCNVRVNE